MGVVRRMANTLKDGGEERDTVITLARSLGVAASTVSRALRGDPRISIETRRRVEALAQERGYATNVLARTLATGRSGLIALGIGPIGNPFYAELMQHAVSAAAARGLRILLLHSGAGPIEDQTAQTLLQYRVDGCLISSAELSSHAARICASHNVPVVMVNRVPRLHASAVACDNFHRRAGARGAAVRRRPPQLRHRARQSRELDQHRARTRLRRVSGHDRDVARSGCASMVNRPTMAGSAPAACSPRCPVDRRPDAIFAVADIMAMGILDALRIGGDRRARRRLSRRFRWYRARRLARLFHHQRAAADRVAGGARVRSPECTDRPSRTAG